MRRAGFTLIEVMAVVFLTAIVFGVALNFYVDLSNQSQHASDVTREIRRATSLLDRVSMDFERTLLAKKPDDMDPLANPWLFLGESRGLGEGSDRVKFVTRRAPDARSVAAVSDITMVSYALYPDDVNGDYQLIRWSQPHLPDGLDRDFPLPDDPDSQLMADGVREFGIRFLGEDGEWVDEWDSSQMLDSSELPGAVEIEVALAPADPETPDDRIARYRRRVLLPVRPLDLTTLLDPVAYAALDGGDATADGECRLRVVDCLDFSALGGNPGAVDPNASPDLSGLAGLSPEDRVAVRALAGADLGKLCWDDFRDAYQNHPAVKPECR
jgi:prepilin-type N-terminal cleavage/methylation domain-containing protein